MHQQFEMHDADTVLSLVQESMFCILMKMRRIKEFYFATFYYKNIIFSDESWFILGPNNYYVWKYEGEVYNSISQEKVSPPPKVMI